MKLIIAEKPELGKAIAAAICDKPVFNRDGSILCGEYTVISAFGHLFKLKQPEEYDIKYKKWTKDALPIFFENWDIVPSADKIGRVNVIGNLLKQADEVIHAGDPDDEGQLLIDEILEYFKYNGKVMRLSTHDNNPEYIRKQLGKMESNEKCRRQRLAKNQSKSKKSRERHGRRSDQAVCRPKAAAGLCLWRRCSLAKGI